jgi:hypothetical protein
MFWIPRYGSRGRPEMDPPPHKKDKKSRSFKEPEVLPARIKYLEILKLKMKGQKK